MSMMDGDVIQFLVFVTILIISGGWIPLIIYYVISIISSYLFEKYTGKHKIIQGKSCVLITGCSTGIGKSAALSLASKGVVVFASVRRKEDGDNLRKESTNIIPIIMDVTNSEQIKESVQFVKQKIESDQLYFVGILNNAGYSDDCILEIQKIERIKKQFDANLFGHIEVTQEFLPLLRKYRSPDIEPRVVFTSSCSAVYPLALVGAYSGSKRALEGICDTLRQEVSKTGVKVIMLEPGSIKTEIHTSSEIKGVNKKKNLKNSKMSVDSIQIFSNNIKELSICWLTWAKDLNK